MGRGSGPYLWVVGVLLVDVRRNPSLPSPHNQPVPHMRNLTAKTRLYLWYIQLPNITLHALISSHRHQKQELHDADFCTAISFQLLLEYKYTLHTCLVWVVCASSLASDHILRHSASFEGGNATLVTGAKLGQKVRKPYVLQLLQTTQHVSILKSPTLSASFNPRFDPSNDPRTTIQPT